MTMMKSFHLSVLLLVLALPLEAQENLLTHFLDSLKASQPKARELIEKASSGDAESMFQLAMCYRRGQSVNADQNECVFWLRKAVEKNHTQAQYYLASYYEEGEGGLPVDSVMAYKLYTQAAKKKNIFSMSALGENYLSFTGVPNAKEECINWLKEISEGHFVDEYFSDIHDNPTVSVSNYKLFLLYQGNDGITQDIPMSMSYLYKSLDNNMCTPEAYNAMGECFLEGYGVEKKKEEAIKWFKKASDRSCGLGTGNLGVILYQEGKYDEAFKLLKDASEDKIYLSPKAMRLLSACYRYGRGTKKDEKLAQLWYEKAVEYKDKTALELMKLKK